MGVARAQHTTHSRGWALLLALLVVIAFSLAGSDIWTPQNKGIGATVWPLGWVVGSSLLLFFGSVVLAHFFEERHLLFGRKTLPGVPLWAMLLWITHPQIWLGEPAVVVLPLSMLAAHYGLETAKCPRAPYAYTRAGLLWGVSSLIWPPSLFFIPFFLIDGAIYRSLSWRNGVAFFLGLCVPCWFLLGILFWTTPIDMLIAFVQGSASLDTEGLSWPSAQALGAMAYCWESFSLQPIWVSLPEFSTLVWLLLVGLAVLTGISGASIALPSEIVWTRQMLLGRMRMLWPLLLGLLFTQHLIGLFIVASLPLAELLTFGMRRARIWQRRLLIWSLLAGATFVWLLGSGIFST